MGRLRHAATSRGFSKGRAMTRSTLATMNTDSDTESKTTPRRGSRGGFSLIEVVFAMVILALITLAGLSISASSTRAMNDGHDTIYATQVAKDQLERLMLNDWKTYTLVFYNDYLYFSNNPVQLPVPFSRTGTTYGMGGQYAPLQNGGWMYVTVREPTAAECTANGFAYNCDTSNTPQGPTRTTPWGPLNWNPNLEVPTPVPPTTNIPTLLLIIVEVRLPARGGQPPINVKLQSWRSYTL